MTKEMNVGDLVRLLMSTYYGVIVEKRDRSLPGNPVVYAYFVHYCDGKKRWELDDSLQLVARGKDARVENKNF